MVLFLLQVRRQATDVWACSLTCTQDDDIRIPASNRDRDLSAGPHTKGLRCSRCGDLFSALQNCMFYNMTALLCWPQLTHCWNVPQQFSTLRRTPSENAAPCCLKPI